MGLVQFSLFSDWTAREDDDQEVVVHFLAGTGAHTKGGCWSADLTPISK
jgi:hypothetical protein